VTNIAWKKYDNATDTCVLGEFLFKRIKVLEIEILEIWEGGELIFRTSQYSEFLKQVMAIIDIKLKSK
jgi:hypothetical protein